MTTVWKYPIEVKLRQRVRMPKGAKILTAQMQGEVLCLWAMVDPAELETVERKIEVLGTGHAASDGPATYLGTAQHPFGNLVWHVFEIW